MPADVGHFLGEGGVKWTLDLPLSEELQEKVTKGYLRRANEDGTPWVERAEDGDGSADHGTAPEEMPTKNATKAEWVGYAARVHGITPDDAEAMTKADLIELFGRTPADG